MRNVGCFITYVHPARDEKLGNFGRHLIENLVIVGNVLKGLGNGPVLNTLT